MPETNIAYPEPIPVDYSTTLNEWLLRAMKDFPAYPEDCILTAPAFIAEQSVHYQSSDLSSETKWASEEFKSNPEFKPFLEQVIGHIRQSFPGDALKWKREFVNSGIDRQTTLKEVAEAGAANCFIRGVVFTGILQKLGIEAKVIQGDWTETTRQRVLGQYAAGTEVEFRDPGTSFGSGLRYLKGEEGEAHAFAFVKFDDRLYFADPALLVQYEDASSRYPLVKEVTEEELLGRDIVFDLPNGKKRHYTFKGQGNPLEVNV